MRIQLELVPEDEDLLAVHGVRAALVAQRHTCPIYSLEGTERDLRALLADWDFDAEDIETLITEGAL